MKPMNSIVWQLQFWKMCVLTVCKSMTQWSGYFSNETHFETTKRNTV